LRRSQSSSGEKQRHGNQQQLGEVRKRSGLSHAMLARVEDLLAHSHGFCCFDSGHGPSHDGRDLTHLHHQFVKLIWEQ
jgi:hypothetical protein